MGKRKYRKLLLSLGWLSSHMEELTAEVLSNSSALQGKALDNNDKVNNNSNS